MTTISEPTQITLFSMNVQLRALRLEMKGMKRRGPSAHSVIKQQWGLKGSKEKVHDEFEKLIKEKEDG